jgi:hypothetical protein
MKRVEVINMLIKHCGQADVQRMQGCHWTKEVKLWRKDFSNIVHRKWYQMRDWTTALGRDSKRILVFSQKRLQGFEH